MTRIVQKAPAKINLTLDILGKRPDGYHEVAMVMHSLALADSVTIESRADGQITLSITGNAKLPTDNSNLAWRAARLFLDAADKHNFGVNLTITKTIPVAAGLAGGSADAAAVLKGMNEMFGNIFSVTDLCHLGEQIGSDIPFCIMGGTMLSTGRGEILRRLPNLPPFYVVLAKPPIEVSTKWAYANYDAHPAAAHPDNAAMEAALSASDAKKIVGLLCNVLESVTIGKHPVIAEYKKMLISCGMQAALMSGSGPTVFSLTADRTTAQKTAEFMRQNTEAEVILTTT